MKTIDKKGLKKLIESGFEGAIIIKEDDGSLCCIEVKPKFPNFSECSPHGAWK